MCGDVISGYICGPLQVKSIGGAKYFLLIKDEYSHYRTVFFIKQKDEAPNLIQKYKMNVKNVFGHKITKFSAPRMGEIINKTVQHFFEQHGIRHETTIPYTPEQNGLIERENPTIVEAARTMLHSCNLNLRKKLDKKAENAFSSDMVKTVRVVYFWNLF